jgi:HD-GYP domain-containing protein (c-di-GMP phosphodiesterase class II)
MLKQPHEAFESFAIDSLLDNTRTDFDLFLAVEGHWVLYAGQDYQWQREELTNLLAHGYTHFLIRSIDLAKANAYRELNKLPTIDETLPPDRRIVAIEEIGAEFIRYLFHGDITIQAVRKGEELAASLTRCVLEDPSCVKHLRALGEYDQYTFGHSVRTTAYATAIALRLGASDDQHLREIAMGCLFHDVGKRNVPLPVLNKTGPLNTDEWSVMRSHPESGTLSVEPSNLSTVSKEIILHHHEKLDGSGYPDRLEKNSLLTEVQIATVADVFDALTSTRAYQNKRSRFEALDFIRHNMLGVKLAKDPYKALIETLSD